MLKWDMRLQYKSGFYLIYVVLTLFYAALLSAFPATWRKTAACIMIFTDPAAMGLFFMGAIVLLEKSQRVLCALTVSPLRPSGYLLSKCVSISVISTLVALALALWAGLRAIPRVLLSTFLSSMAFSAMGLAIGAGAQSINQFFLRAVPIEILCFVPALFYLFDAGPAWLRYYPVNACMGLLAGRGDAPTLDLFLIAVLLAALYFIALAAVERMWKTAGGVKL